MRQVDVVRIQRAVKAFSFEPLAAAGVALLRVQDPGLNSVSALSIRRVLLRCFTAGVDAVLTDTALQREVDAARAAQAAGGPRLD